MGSTAGEVNYPVHMRLAQQDMLFADVTGAIAEEFTKTEYDLSGDTSTNYSIIGDITLARTNGGTNPHTLAAAYDPGADLAVAQARAQRVHDVADIASPVTDIAAYVNSAESLVDQLLKFDDTKIDDAVAAFDASSKVRFRRRSSMVAAGLFDIRATMSSTFGQAMALEEQERMNAVDQFEASLRNSREDQRINQRAGLIVDLADKSLRLQALKFSTIMQGAQIQEQTSRNKIVASQDQINFDLSREIDDQQWDLNLYQHFNAGLGAASGLAVGPVGPTKLERALGVAFAGVSAVATLAGALS